jgi:hypothetical protein
MDALFVVRQLHHNSEERNFHPRIEMGLDSLLHGGYDPPNEDCPCKTKLSVKIDTCNIQYLIALIIHETETKTLLYTNRQI